MNSKIKGVAAYGRRFRAQLNRVGRIFYLGSYATRSEAAAAYDRGAVLSEAWAKRSLDLNFERPKGEILPVSDEEKDLMTYLRTHHPQYEVQFHHNAAIQSGVPESLLDRAKREADNVSALMGSLRGTILDLRDGYVRLQSYYVGAQKKIEFLDQQLANAESELARFRSVSSEPMLPVVMRRVTPLPEPPPSDELQTSLG